MTIVMYSRMHKDHRLRFYCLPIWQLLPTGSPDWRAASANCSRLRSERSLWLSLPGARHPANPFLSRAGGRRLRKAANWATMRVMGEAGVVGKRRGWEGPLEASASHSHPSRPPGPPVPRGSADSFVKRGRGSLVPR